MEIAWLCEMEKPRLGTDHDLNISDLAIQSHKKEIIHNRWCSTQLYGVQKYWFASRSSLIESISSSKIVF